MYRLSGSSATIKALEERFNTEHDVDLLSHNEHYDINAVAGLLKSFFRELPEPITTNQRHREFLHVVELQDRNERIMELQRLVKLLPPPNYCIIRVLIAHLIRVVSNSEQNKMTAMNISIVFSPTLNIPGTVLNLLMSEYGVVFQGESLEEAGLNRSYSNIAHERELPPRQISGLRRDYSNRNLNHRLSHVVTAHDIDEGSG